MMRDEDVSEWNRNAVVKLTAGTTRQQTTICGCVGPQNGEPLCPCQMRGIIVRDGRYIRPEQDLGPVSTPPQSTVTGAP
jgi:hypothetical protein